MNAIRGVRLCFRRYGFSFWFVGVRRLMQSCATRDYSVVRCSRAAKCASAPTTAIFMSIHCYA
ncbi:hypothetical protein WS94_28335 [Burkholderia territorii]|nr:hypothetical protein WS94_28335 [Burkholderia territorii]